MKWTASLFAHGGEKKAATTNDPTVDAEAAIPGTIVIAEDDTTTRMILGRILRKQNYRVVDVADGSLACEAVRSERPDVVLLDWAMPVMDGLTALRRLKADRATCDVPVVMLTARTEVEERRLALEAGASGFLTKPCDSVELVECIAMHLNERASLARSNAV